MLGGIPMLRWVTSMSIRRPALVVAAWLVVVAGCFAVGVWVFERLEPDVGLVPGSESDRGFVLLREAEPQPVVLTAVVHGRAATDPQVRDAVATAVDDLR